ncbi:FAD dependent oxidoreductase, partial [human gut metagenome]
MYRSTPVTNIEKIDGGWQLTTPNGSFAARYVVNAAGLNAQAIHEMAAPHTFTLEPTRGEYYLLDKSEGNRVNHVIFQCPNENGKGVLVTPTVHGNLLVGPNAQPVAGDDTACTADGLAFVAATARRSVPGIRFGESIRNFAGVRANVDTGDFVIGEADGAPGFIDLAGM